MHPDKQTDSRSGLRNSQQWWNVWFWIAPVTWLDVRQKKGSGMLHSAELGHNSSDMSDRLSRNPPPWSMMPSAMNLHSHHWSCRAGHLQRAGLQSQLMQELFTTPASDVRWKYPTCNPKFFQTYRMAWDLQTPETRETICTLVCMKPHLPPCNHY